MSAAGLHSAADILRTRKELNLMIPDLGEAIADWLDHLAYSWGGYEPSQQVPKGPYYGDPTRVAGIILREARQ